jgi:hypothetical protein
MARVPMQEIMFVKCYRLNKCMEKEKKDKCPHEWMRVLNS